MISIRTSIITKSMQTGTSNKQESAQPSHIIPDETVFPKGFLFEGVK